MDKITCVFVHGWAMNAAVWDSSASLLPDWIDAIFVDLPGHGSMHEVSAGSLDDIAHAVAAVHARPAVWVGWSLGGLVCQQIGVRYPERVSALYLVAASPRFVQADAWPCAVGDEVFADFARMFDADVEATIRRFLALQVTGSVEARATLRQLEQSLHRRGMPDSASLRVCLDILRQADLRDTLAGAAWPTGWLLGEKDRLVPPCLRDVLPALNPAMTVDVLPGAGHAPFVSNPRAFVDSLLAFIGSSRQSRHGR